MNRRFYDLPATLEADIKKLGEYVADYKSGKLNPVQFKGIRVGYGIYEQREANTFMMRTRTPAGALTPCQLKRVAEVSRDHGIHKFSITTRQEFQLQYLKIDELVEINNKLAEVGLSGRAGGGNCVRNMVGSFDSGVRKDEVFDINPYVNALTSRMVAETDSYDLPRKLKFSFSNHPDDTALVRKHCVGFIAKIQDGRKGFQVWVGGGTGASAKKGKMLLDWVPDHRVYYVAKAVKQLFDRYGNRRQRNQAKIKWLYDKLGKERFESLFFRYYGLIQQELGLELQIAELPNEAQVKAGYAAEAVADSAAFELWKKRFVTVQKQAGIFQVRIPILHGNVENEDGIKLADFLENFGENVLRLTSDQNVSLRNIPEAYLGNVFNLVHQLSTLSDKPTAFGNMIACTGAATCTLGVTLSRPAAEALQAGLEQRGVSMDKYQDLRIQISGCPNACANNWTSDIGIFGRADKKEHELYPGYMIQLGSHLVGDEIFFAEKVANVAHRHLADLLADFFLDFEKNGKGELRPYLQTQEAKNQILALCEKYDKLVPTLEEDKSFYNDLQSDEPFSLLKGKKPECAAGLFDMIAVSFAALEKLQVQVKDKLNADEKEEVLYNMVLNSAHSLLVTRGIEAHEDTDAFEGFIQHFIKANLVPTCFLGLVQAAKNGDRAKLVKEQEGVIGLVQHMEGLYESMDDSLRFNLPEVAETTASSESKAKESDADQVKDFTGVACPMNFVKTKLALSPMKAGETLEVLLDDGEPIANVPGSVKLEGHSILNETQREDGSWSILIQKAGAQPKPKEEATPIQYKTVADKFMDFTGVPCPMNFVKTKLALTPMESGQTLEVLLDDGEPIANVPGSVKLEGHEVLSETHLDSGNWSVVIKKA